MDAWDDHAHSGLHKPSTGKSCDDSLLTPRLKAPPEQIGQDAARASMRYIVDAVDEHP